MVLCGINPRTLELTHRYRPSRNDVNYLNSTTFDVEGSSPLEANLTMQIREMRRGSRGYQRISNSSIVEFESRLQQYLPRRCCGDCLDLTTSIVVVLSPLETDLMMLVCEIRLKPPDNQAIAMVVPVESCTHDYTCCCRDTGYFYRLHLASQRRCYILPSRGWIWPTTTSQTRVPRSRRLQPCLP
jgi:hypothetical protein